MLGHRTLSLAVAAVAVLAWLPPTDAPSVASGHRATPVRVSAHSITARAAAQHADGRQASPADTAEMPATAMRSETQSDRPLPATEDGVPAHLPPHITVIADLGKPIDSTDPVVTSGSETGRVIDLGPPVDPDAPHAQDPAAASVHIDIGDAVPID